MRASYKVNMETNRHDEWKVANCPGAMSHGSISIDISSSGEEIVSFKYAIIGASLLYISFLGKRYLTLFSLVGDEFCKYMLIGWLRCFWC
jgi:hypothetical protein